MKFSQTCMLIFYYSDVDENEEEEENEQSPEDFLADDEDSRLIEQVKILENHAF